MSGCFSGPLQVKQPYEKLSVPPSPIDARCHGQNLASQKEILFPKGDKSPTAQSGWVN